MLAQYVFCFGSISVCISQNNHKVITKGSQTDPKVGSHYAITVQVVTKWQPIDPSVVTKWLSTHRLVTKRPPRYPNAANKLSPNDPKLIPNRSQIGLKVATKQLRAKWPESG